MKRNILIIFILALILNFCSSGLTPSKAQKVIDKFKERDDLPIIRKKEPKILFGDFDYTVDKVIRKETLEKNGNMVYHVRTWITPTAELRKRAKEVEKNHPQKTIRFALLVYRQFELIRQDKNWEVKRMTINDKWENVSDVIKYGY